MDVDALTAEALPVRVDEGLLLIEDVEGVTQVAAGPRLTVGLEVDHGDEAVLHAGNNGANRADLSDQLSAARSSASAAFIS